MSIYDDELADVMRVEYAKRARNKRCRARVSLFSLTVRSKHSTTDPRCLRLAKINGLCRQHDAAVKNNTLRWCQAPGCSHSAVTKERDHWFCQQHAPLWRTHHEILDRILSIPPRD